MLKTRTWIFILVGVLLLCGLAMLLLRSADAGAVAEIVQDGKVLRRIDLAAVTEEYSFTIRSEYGENVVTVQPGRICVSSADCPDRTCVQFGWLSDGAVPILCMPHKLMIRMARAGSVLVT